MSFYRTIAHQKCLRLKRTVTLIVLGMLFMFAISIHEKYDSMKQNYIAQETSWVDIDVSNHNSSFISIPVQKSIGNVHSSTYIDESNHTSASISIPIQRTIENVHSSTYKKITAARNSNKNLAKNIMVLKKQIHITGKLHDEKEKINSVIAKVNKENENQNYNKISNKNNENKIVSYQKHFGGLHEDKKKKFFCTIPESVTPVLEERRQHAAAACNRLKMDLPPRWRLRTSPSPSMLKKLQWDQKNHLIYCNIPKAASTTWSWHLLRAVGVKDDVISKAENAHQLLKKYLQHPEPEDFKTGFLDSAIKFLVTRHPFERLVSAYQNKIADLSIKRKKYQDIRKELISKYYGDLPVEDQPQVPSFSEFCRYVIDELETWLKHDAQGGDYTPDQHWLPQTFICSPCNIQYDIFSEMSTMSSDAEYIAKQCGLEDVIMKTMHLNPSTSNYLHQSNTDTDSSLLAKNVNQTFSKIYNHSMEQNVNGVSTMMHEYETSSNDAKNFKITKNLRGMNLTLINKYPYSFNKHSDTYNTNSLYKPSTNINHYEKYFHELSELEIRHLYKLYKFDFEIFGYDIMGYLK